MIYCNTCGLLPEKEENLPITLPENVEFLPTGQSPLKVLKDWPKCKCPQCGGDAKRDTDTMDTFVDSSWYFYRYLEPHNDQSAINPERVKQWLPADVYSGGIEHAILHLLYTRFWTKAMRDLGLIDFGEPFRMVRNQGIILGEDNEKMSKSRGNVVDPDNLVAEYGSDTVRLYLQFIGPWDMGGPWAPRGVNGLANWLGRIWSLFLDPPADSSETFSAKDLNFAINSAIKKVTEDTENFKFNTAIAAMMELTNTLGKMKRSNLYDTPQWKQTLHSFNLLLAPYAPHLAEELWHRQGNTTSVHLGSWPSYDATTLIRDTVKMAVQVNGKLRAEIEVSKDADKETILQTAKAEPNVAKHLTGEIVREIVVPGKLVNLVVKG
jgi:leucyl-tRNA synthetase